VTPCVPVLILVPEIPKVVMELTASLSASQCPGRAGDESIGSGPEARRHGE
jgi:hypothetical protein